MKKRIVRPVLGLAMATTLVAPAHAGIPVFDALNFASNVVSNFQLAGIKHQLSSTQKGTVVYNTENIDNSTHNIDKSTTHIDESTHKSMTIDIKNIEIDTSFTWIINKGGDEIIPIPRDVKQKLKAFVGGEGAGAYESFAGRYNDAQYYAERKDVDLVAPSFEGSRARKAANDMLVRSIHDEQVALEDEVTAVKELEKLGQKVKGHGNQMQLANALAGSQINQMMKLRNAMLVSEAHRVAEAQANADKEARSIAVAQRMRAGLDERLSGARPLAAAP